MIAQIVLLTRYRLNYYIMLLAMLSLGQILFCLCISSVICAYCNHSENLVDVWHYDVGLTTIGATRIDHQAREIERSPQDTRPNQWDVTNNRPPLPPAQQNYSGKLIDLDIERDGGEDKCDFQGRNLRVAVSPQPPFVDCLQDLYGDWLCNGSNIELIHVLERRFNFKSDWIVIANNHIDDDRPDTNKPWRKGSESKGGTSGELASISNQAQMSAVVNLVAAGRAMLSANGFMRTIDRSARNLAVSEPFDIFRLHLLLSKSVRNHDHIFIKPFHPNAWLAILCSAALIVPVFYFINTTSAYYVLEDDKQLNRISLVDCWNYYKRMLSPRLVSPFKRARSVSLSSSDLSLDREISTMLMLEPRGATAATSGAGRSNQNTEPAYTIDDNGFGVSRRAAAFEFALPIRISAGRNGGGTRQATRRNLRLAKRQWTIERMQFRRLARRKRRSGFFNVAYCVWYVVASLSNQGGETEDLPRANSTRILIAFWWLYLIVIGAIHSGILTAILTFPKQHDFIDDYLNLKPSELTNLHLSVEKHSELAHLLINSDNLHKSSLQLLKEHNVPISYVNFPRNRQRILDSIQVGQTALIEEISTIKQIITREYYDSKRTKCMFKSSRYPIDVIPMSLVLSDRMPNSCIRLINATLSRIMQSGLARKWRRNFESSGNNCLNSVEINAGDVDKVELRHVILAFWMLAGGAGVGLLFLIGEVIWLFTVGDEDEDEEQDSNSGLGSASYALSFSSSSSSSVETSTSDESDRVRLGFRRALMPPDNQLGAIRSLKAHHLHVNTLLRKTKRSQKRRNQRDHHHQGQQQLQAPKIIFTVDIDQDEDENENESDGGGDYPMMIFDETDGLKEVSELHARRMQERRNRRLAREAERRAKRIQRTVELLKRVHGGHIYSDRLKRRVRRLSHSLAGRFSLAPNQGSSQEPTTSLFSGSSSHLTAKRTRRAGSVHFGTVNCRVAPTK